MKHSLDFYAGVLAVHKSPSSNVNDLLKEMLDDMASLIEENEAHERAATFSAPGLKIADNAAADNFTSRSWHKDVEGKLRSMDKVSRDWIIARPNLQKDLGLRLIEKDGQPWLEEIPEIVDEAQDQQDGQVDPPAPPASEKKDEIDYPF